MLHGAAWGEGEVREAQVDGAHVGGVLRAVQEEVSERCDVK